MTALVGRSDGRFQLLGEDLSAHDGEPSEPVNAGRPPSRELAGVLEILEDFRKSIDTAPRSGRLAAVRKLMDELGSDHDTSCELIDTNAAGVPAEWVIAPGADAEVRLLYLHGGAFVGGSRRSHRRLTTELSRRTQAAVLAIDYRLLPEHRRLDGIADCQTAYRWLIDNGPGGSRPARHLFVAGDSAGGNLVLMLIACVRDAGVRPPDGAVALCPTADSTLSSPSLERNSETDLLVGPLVKIYRRLPRTLFLWLGWLACRISPSDPLVSPLHGDLSRLPPVLLHASESEVLLDDARRYARKARAAGSPVTLETWCHMPHVWHLFVDRLPEAQEAFARIAAFLDRCRA